MTTIRERVIKVIADQFGLSPAAVKDTDTIDSLGGDSLDAVECLMGLEEEFECDDVDDETSMRWSTVAECIAYFENAVKPTEPVKPKRKAAKKSATLDVPGLAVFAHRAEIAYKTACFTFSSAVRQQTTKLVEAEEKATFKALTGASRLEILATAIAATAKKEAAVEAANQVSKNGHRIIKGRYYVVREYSSKLTVLKGPYVSSRDALAGAGTMRNKSNRVTRVGYSVMSGLHIVKHGIEFAPGFSHPLLNAASVNQSIKCTKANLVGKIVSIGTVKLKVVSLRSQEVASGGNHLIAVTNEGIKLLAHRIQKLRTGKLQYTPA